MSSNALDRLDTLPAGYIVIKDDGTIEQVNATLAGMLGYSSVELLGWHFQKLLPPGGRIFYQTHVFPLLKLHGVAEEIYIPLRKSDGSDVPMLMNAVRRDAGTRPLNEFLFVRMMQRHEFEEQLIQARRLAEEANAAKVKFLSMMSHDLRTPLTSISGNAELVRSGFFGPANEEQQQSMASIREACNDLLQMINDILSFAQLDSHTVQIRPRAVALKDSVARAVSMITVAAQQADLKLTLGTGCDALIHADPDRLQQILLNLLANAIKFTPGGGTIRIDCELTESHARIRVSDTGIGISQEQQPRIFEPFVQLPEAERAGPQHGVGLGLSISRELARAMGGELTVESAVGRGSTFTIELPLETGSARTEITA